MAGATALTRGRVTGYPDDMARGWESKAIESQQADRDARGHAAPVRSPEDHARAVRAETVALALADATAQLGAACRPVHRDLLRQRVEALQTILAELRVEPDGGR